MTPPAEQSIALLDAGACVLPMDVRNALARITYDPCFALLAVLDSPPRLPEPGALQLQSEPIAWMADNHRKGISPNVFTVTIHAGAEFTREHWDAKHEIIAEKLLSAAHEWLGDSVQSWQVHRWRYSQPRVLHPEACLVVTDGAPLVFAGDGFGAPTHRRRSNLRNYCRRKNFGLDEPMTFMKKVTCRRKFVRPVDVPSPGARSGQKIGKVFCIAATLAANIKMIPVKQRK